MYLINFSGVNESDKEFLMKEIFNDKNDVRHLLLYNNLHNKRWRTNETLF